MPQDHASLNAIAVPMPPDLDTNQENADAATTSTDASAPEPAPAAAPAPATAPSRRVLRVSADDENIGARVPMSKKRLTWQFVFADSAQVHTVVLEHSRVTAKKRLHVDGKKLYSSAHHYSVGDWKHSFQVQDDDNSHGTESKRSGTQQHATVFCVTIQDVKSTVVDAKSVYDLRVDDTPWAQLGDRVLPRVNSSDAVWSSALFARRVSFETSALQGQDDEGHPLAGKAFHWTFAFGTHGTIHRLELRDAERDDVGEFMVILDSRMLAQVAHDSVDADFWEYDCPVDDQHTLRVLVTLLDDTNDTNDSEEEHGPQKRVEFFINGCAWTSLGETDFVLQPDWFPVFSRSRGTSYFRNAKTGVCQWERPIQNRKGSIIDVPQRLSTMEVPVPADEFNAEGLRRSSEKVPVRISDVDQGNQPAAIPEVEPEFNLMDFSDMTKNATPSTTTKQPPSAVSKPVTSEPVLDLLS